MRLITAMLFLASTPGFSAALPLFFFPNTGQTVRQAEFIVQTPDLSARFRADGVIFQVPGQHIGVRFVDANPGVAIGGLAPLAAKVNFFLGQAGWKTDIPSYSKIVYRGLYPGIDMTYGGTGRAIKSEFLVAPKADPRLIRLEYSDPVSVDAGGNLIAGDTFREAAPEIYQQIGAARVKVAGRYLVFGDHTIGFEIAAYDKSVPLVIDPVISYCTFLGGSSPTAINGVAVDSSANLYVTGWTSALDFPIAGAVDAANQGGVDIIVAKLNAAGTALVYATYIGGRGDDQGAAIAVDSLGQAYVTGFTSSTNFPLVSSNRGAIGGSTTAFALKLNAIGNALLYSGYLGGTNYEEGNAIAVDSSGNAYIAGDTQSTNFPTVNATQAAIGGGTDAFITKLNSAGAITFSTFLGGSGNDHAGGIAVDSLGNIFVAGGTFSANFPLLLPVQPTRGGGQDAFVTKIGFAGTIAFSTYLGGSAGSVGSPEQANAIALDSSGNAYIAGVTDSTNFPVSTGAFQTALNGAQNVFVAKLTSNGQSLVYSTYIGGEGTDWATGIAVSAAGNAYVAGYTSSVNFPQAIPVQAAFGGLFDAFVSEVNFAGNGLIFSTYYGGSGSDSANAIALDTNTNIFVGGQTSSSDIPLVNPIESNSVASSTGWLLRLGVTPPPATTPSVTSVSPTSGSGNTVTFTAIFTDTGGGSTLTTATVLVNTNASTAFGCYVNYNAAMNLFSLFTDAGTAVLATVSPGGASAQNDQCALAGVGSSGTVSGNTLTVTFALTFQPTFAGAMAVYLQAGDSSSKTGMLAEGAFTIVIPVGTPQVNSVSPNSGGGPGQVFTFVYSDTVFAQNLATVAFLFNTSPVFTNACYVVYNLAANTVALEADNGLSSTSMQLGASTTLQNSQCQIGATSSAVSGLSINWTVSITFKVAFNGTKNIYLYATAGSLNTGWVLEGTFAATNGGTPTAVSSDPASGTGAGERFTFVLADPGGANHITYGAILFASTFNMLNACYLEWDGVANTVSVTFDNPAQGQTPFTPGTPGIATNSQCTLNAANSSISMSATQVFITLDLTFNSSFFGPKNIYLYGAEGSINSGWTTVGTWTVTGGTPSATSASPSSGAGSLQSFFFTISDSSSQTNLTGVSILFTNGAPVNVTNACNLFYNRTAQTIGLWDNTGHTTLSTKGEGFSTLLQNSQCGVQYTQILVSTNQSVTLQIQILFNTTNFPGPKSIYLEANEPNNASSGFVYIGSWTVQ
jgi:hypothetical protein